MTWFRREAEQGYEDEVVEEKSKTQPDSARPRETEQHSENTHTRSSPEIGAPQGDGASFPGTPTPMVATQSMVEAYEVSPRVLAEEPKAEEYLSRYTFSSLWIPEGRKRGAAKAWKPSTRWGCTPSSRNPPINGRRTKNRKSQEPVLRALHVLEVGCTFGRGRDTCGWEQRTPAGLAPATKPSDVTDVAESHR